MTIFPKFSFNWTSIQGSEQLENRDAGGIYACCSYTFAIIMDALDKGGDAILFNAIWIRSLLSKLPSEIPTQAFLIQAMKEAHQQLRLKGLIHERACYAALLIPHDGSACTAFVCGDCLVGSFNAQYENQWLTPIHTLKSTLEHIAGEEVSYQSRHQVTRVLKARRFEMPEVVELDSSEVNSWVLATDGYWDNKPIASKSPLDDCSVMRLSIEIERKNTAASNNLHLAGFYSST